MRLQYSAKTGISDLSNESLETVCFSVDQRLAKPPNQSPFSFQFCFILQVVRKCTNEHDLELLKRFGCVQTRRKGVKSVMYRKLF